MGCVCSWSVAAPVSPMVLYVAPDGNDRWTGTSAEAHPGTFEGPFATPQRAVLAIRELKNEYGGRLPRPVTIRLRGGTYYLSAPWILTPADSGHAQCPVVIQANEDERPILSGGRKITGWKPVTIDGKKLWATEIHEVRDGNWNFESLWINGQRRNQARHPNQGLLQIAGLPDVATDTAWNEGQERFEFFPGDIKSWNNLDDVKIVALQLWISVHLRIATVDDSKHVVTLKKASSYRLSSGFGKEPAPYYLVNAFEFLDVPGEWYLDRPTGRLYVMAQPSDDLNQSEVIAPVLESVVRFECDPAQGETIDHLTFQDITFSHSAYVLPQDQTGDQQSAVFVPGSVRGEGLHHCTFQNCTFSHNNNYGLELGRGCQNNWIVDCSVFDTGAGGIKVGEGTIRKNPEEQTFGNSVLNCHLYDGGHILHQGVGIWMPQSYNNRIAFCHIHDYLYSGLSIGWTWGYSESLARGNIIEFNHIHHIGKRADGEGPYLSDMGGIYTLGIQPGTVIRNNVFHDIAGSHYGGWGIYFDEGGSQILAEKNIVYRTTDGGFHQHYGKENIVRNNIFALGKKYQLYRTRLEDHTSFTFENNIVYWQEGDLLAGNWEDRFIMDRNLYWNAEAGDIRFGKLSWDEWQKKGWDMHSLTADPQFTEPANDDFTLKDGSPAFKLGFQPIPPIHQVQNIQ